MPFRNLKRRSAEGNHRRCGDHNEEMADNMPTISSASSRSQDEKKSVARIWAGPYDYRRAQAGGIEPADARARLGLPRLWKFQGYGQSRLARNIPLWVTGRGIRALGWGGRPGEQAAQETVGQTKESRRAGIFRYWCQS